MLKTPYRLFIDGEEVKSTKRYCHSVILQKIIKRQKICIVRVETTSMENGKVTTYVQKGKYAVVGRLRPVMYHITGDNPLEQPAPIPRTKANLADTSSRQYMRKLINESYE